MAKAAFVAVVGVGFWDEGFCIGFLPCGIEDQSANWR